MHYLFDTMNFSITSRGIITLSNDFFKLENAMKNNSVLCLTLLSIEVQND